MSLNHEQIPSQVWESGGHSTGTLSSWGSWLQGRRSIVCHLGEGRAGWRPPTGSLLQFSEPAGKKGIDNDIWRWWQSKRINMSTNIVLMNPFLIINLNTTYCYTLCLVEYIKWGGEYLPLRANPAVVPLWQRSPLPVDLNSVACLPFQVLWSASFSFLIFIYCLYPLCSSTPYFRI